jgi:hypothetical protein
VENAGGRTILFEMQTSNVGTVGLIVHPKSIEVFQKDRKQIIANSIDEATNILAMALNGAAARFVTEQAWEEVHVELGDPKLVGSPHYAFRSKAAKLLTDAGQSHLNLSDGKLHIDNSLEVLGDTEYGEVETCDKSVADALDRGIRKALSLETELPAIISTAVEKEMGNRSTWTDAKTAELSEQLNELFKKTMKSCISPINTELAALAAHVQSGNNIAYEVSQLTTILAVNLKKYSELEMRVDEMQESKTGLVMELLHLRNENQALKAKLGK